MMSDWTFEEEPCLLGGLGSSICMSRRLEALKVCSVAVPSQSKWRARGRIAACLESRLAATPLP